MGDRLVEYIKENKLEAFRRAMKSHERFDLDSSYCLHWAVLSVRVEMVEILLSCGADVNCPGLYNNQTPLHVAASVHGEGHMTLMNMLLVAGANPNVGIVKSVAAPVPVPENPDAAESSPLDIQATPLIELVSRGDMAGSSLLIDAGADLNLADADGYTPLTMAIERNNDAMVKLLLEMGASIEAVGPSGRSAYEMASESIQKILSTHRGPKKGKHTKEKKGWFGGLFKGGDKPGDTPSPKKKKDKSSPATTSIPPTPTSEVSEQRSNTTKQVHSNGSDKTNGIAASSPTHAMVLNESSSTTPAKALNLAPVLDSTPYTSPSKPGAASPFTPYSLATPQNNNEEYITVAEHNKQISALEKRIHALERKFEVQNELLDTQAEQIAVLLNSKGKL